MCHAAEPRAYYCSARRAESKSTATLAWKCPNSCHAEPFCAMLQNRGHIIAHLDELNLNPLPRGSGNAQIHATLDHQKLAWNSVKSTSKHIFKPKIGFLVKFYIKHILLSRLADSNNDVCMCVGLSVVLSFHSLCVKRISQEPRKRFWW